MQVLVHRHIGVTISPSNAFFPPYMLGVAPSIHVPFHASLPTTFHPSLASHPPPHFHLAPHPCPTHPPPPLQFPMFPPSPLRPHYTIHPHSPMPPPHPRPHPPPPYSPTTLVSSSRVARSILQRVGVYRSPLRPLQSIPSPTVPPSFVTNVDVATSSAMPSTLASKEVV